MPEQDRLPVPDLATEDIPDDVLSSCSDLVSRHCGSWNNSERHYYSVYKHLQRFKTATNFGAGTLVEEVAAPLLPADRTLVGLAGAEPWLGVRGRRHRERLRYQQAQGSPGPRETGTGVRTGTECMIGPRATVKDQVDLSSQPALAADIEIEADSACRPETAYEGLGVPDVTVTVTDNDVPGVTVNRVSVTVTEGRATDTYTVVLTTQPSSSATVTVDDSAADVSATPTTLTFTASKLRCSRRPGHGPPRPSPGNAPSGGRAAECNRAVRDAAARDVGIVREGMDERDVDLLAPSGQRPESPQAIVRGHPGPVGGAPGDPSAAQPDRSGSEVAARAQRDPWGPRLRSWGQWPGSGKKISISCRSFPRSALRAPAGSFSGLWPGSGASALLRFFRVRRVVVPSPAGRCSCLRRWCPGGWFRGPASGTGRAVGAARPKVGAHDLGS